MVRGIDKNGLVLLGDPAWGNQKFEAHRFRKRPLGDRAVPGPGILNSPNKEGNALLKIIMFSIHHISLSVKDIDDSIEFYQRLGLKKVSEWNSENNSLTIVHMSLNGSFLEFFCFTDNK